MLPLRIGIIGTGFIARTHVDAFRRAALLFADLGCAPAVVAVADVAPEPARAFADAMAIGRASGDWREIVAAPDIDLIAIATPNDLHFPIAMATMDSGKAVYCEKPLALTRQEAFAMVGKARATGARTFVAFNNLFAPSTQLARRLLDAGEIGAPHQFGGSFDQGFYADPALPASWRTRRRQAGTGALGDLGSHVISIAQHLIGPITEVMALEMTLFKDRPLPGAGAGYGARAAASGAREAVENDDLVQALVRFESGAVGSIGASRVAPGKVFGINWEMRGADGAMQVEDERANELQLFRMAEPADARGYKTLLCGSQVDGFKQGFFGFDYGGGGIGYFDVKVLEIRAMLRALAEDADWECDFAFGARNQAVVDAIHGSALAGGRPTRVEVLP